MTNVKQHQEQDELDRMLDAVLVKYAAESRPGLEERVLANLRAEQARVPDHAWWRWSAIAVVAAVIVVVLALTVRSDKRFHPVVANHASNPTKAPKEPATLVASNASRNNPQEHGPRRGTIAHHFQARVSTSANPKLNEFPSPQPLSEQELALRRYVSEFPQEATLIARAQEEYDKEIRQEMKDVRSDAELFNSDQQER